MGSASLKRPALPAAAYRLDRRSGLHHHGSAGCGAPGLQMIGIDEGKR